MHETGHSGLVHWNDPEGWDGEGVGWRVQDGGTRVYPWLIYVNVWQKPNDRGEDCLPISIPIWDFTQ